MEPAVATGRQSVANGTAAKTAETSQDRCRGLQEAFLRHREADIDTESPKAYLVGLAPVRGRARRRSIRANRAARPTPAALMTTVPTPNTSPQDRVGR
jgi:hypothetical protein